MKLPTRRFPAPEIDTPAVVLSPITLAASAIVPPIVLPGEPTTTPMGLCRSSLPASVPMKLPITTFAEADAPRDRHAGLGVEADDVPRRAGDAAADRVTRAR